MPRTLSRTGVTPEDIAAARRHRDEQVAAHDAATEAAQARLAEMKGSTEDGTLPVTSEIIETVEELFAEADTLGLEVDRARQHLATLQGRAFGGDAPDQMPDDTQRARGFAAPVSLGRTLVESERFAAAAEQRDIPGLRNVPLADIAQTALILSRRNPAMAALFDGSPGVPVDQRVWPPVATEADPAATVLDLITIGPMDSDTLHYTEETVRDIDVQGRVPGLGAESLLPESNIELVGREVAVVDRGSVLPVPVRALEDQAQLRSWLDGRLARGVERDTESQVIAGSGTGQNFEGVLNRAGIGSYQRAFGEPKAAAIHRGITLVRVRYDAEPDAIVYRPETYEDFVLERADDGHYVNTQGPFGALGQTLWGKRAVTSTAIGYGAGVEQAIVAFWPEALLLIREGLEIREFDQHEDFARRLLVLLRARYRAAFKVMVPRAFAHVDLNEAADPGV